MTTPRLQVVKGSRDLLLKFLDSLHISGTVGARNVKFGSQIYNVGILTKERNARLVERGRERVT